jgi:hypothetical protein
MKIMKAFNFISVLGIIPWKLTSGCYAIDFESTERPQSLQQAGSEKVTTCTEVCSEVSVDNKFYHLHCKQSLNVGYAKLFEFVSNFRILFSGTSNCQRP